MKSGHFKAGLLSALTALALVATACRPDSAGSGKGTNAGAIVLSRDDAKLYIADTDNNQVVVVDRVAQTVEKTIAVGRSPERVVVAPDGRLFVSNRMSRSVSVVDPDAGKELLRIPVGTEPTGLALSPDGETLAVANTTNNTISLIDTRSLAVTQTIPTEADPTGVVFVNKSKVYVTHARSGTISVFEPATGARQGGPLSLALTTTQTGGQTRLPGQPADPTVGPDGKVYVPTAQSKEDPTPTIVGEPNSGYAGGGPSGSVPVVASGIATIDPESDTVLKGAGVNASGCFECEANSANRDAVPPSLMTTLNGLPMSGPSAAAVEPSGRFLYVTNMNSGNVAILTTDGSLLSRRQSDAKMGPFPGGSSNGVTALVKVGAGPKGIAITSAGDIAYVYNSFDETVSVLGNGENEVVQKLVFRISKVPLNPEQQLGRRLFFAADDTRMTDPQSGGIACASCHPGGREDGRTWKFSEGPRNTPSLAGRGLVRTAPFHWDGLLEDMHAFRKIVEERMGGTGEVSSTQGQSPLDETDFNAILAYLDTLPSPDNPALNVDGTPVNAEAVARGKVVFEGKAQCAACHSGADRTDNGFHNVGTQINLGANGSPELFPHDVNTPPLHGLFFTGPYLHDGSVATLEDRVNPARNPSDMHGVTSTLTQEERSDLVEYLRTL